MLRGSRSFLATVLVLVSLTTYFIFWRGLPFFLAERPALRETLLVLPYILLGLLGFLGLRMHQYRILFSALLFAIVYGLLSMKTPWARGMTSSRASLIALAIPISLLAMTFLKSGKLFSRYGAAFLLAVIGPFLVEWIMAAWAPSWMGNILFFDLIPWPRKWGVRVPDVALLLVLAYAGSVYFLKDRYFKDFHAAVAFALIPLYFFLNRPGISVVQSAIALTGVGFTLLYGMYHLYWSKVYIDELTGVPNRRALDEKLMQLDRGYSIAMADIDHFKKFNDRFGHDEGDNVLRFVAAHMAEETSSRAYRYGGEEFCMIFEGLASNQVVDILEGARASLASKDFYIRGSSRSAKSPKDRGAGAKGNQKVKVTLSIGVASPSEKAPTPAEVIQVADQLLYKAKDRGRNQVVAEK